MTPPFFRLVHVVHIEPNKFEYRTDFWDPQDTAFSQNEASAPSTQPIVMANAPHLSPDPRVQHADPPVQHADPPVQHPHPVNTAIRPASSKRLWLQRDFSEESDSSEGIRMCMRDSSHEVAGATFPRPHQCFAGVFLSYGITTARRVCME